MSLHLLTLAMNKAVADAMPDASAEKQRAIAQRLLKFNAYYFVDEKGDIKTYGNTSIADEVAALRNLEPELFADEAPAAPIADERKYPGNRTLAEVQAIKDPQERLQVLAEGEGKPQVVESWRQRIKPAGLPNGMDADAFAKLDPMEKLRIANEQAAKANGWDYSGRAF